MTTFHDYSREQYELLLSVGDLQEVRRSVHRKRLAAMEHGDVDARYDAFIDRIDLRMMALAERCAGAGVDVDFARITNGFPSPSSPDPVRPVVAA